MALIDYTTYDEVRAALGVSDDELADETLELPVYSTGVEEDLYVVSRTLTETYRGIEGKEEDDRSAAEARVYRLVRSFSTYSAARQIGTALPMFSPKSLSDGKASMSRFSGEPYKDVLKGLTEQFDLVRGRLILALEDLSSSTTTPRLKSLLTNVGSAYDPVTGA